MSCTLCGNPLNRYSAFFLAHKVYHWPENKAANIHAGSLKSRIGPFYVCEYCHPVNTEDFADIIKVIREKVGISVDD